MAKIGKEPETRILYVAVTVNWEPGVRVTPVVTVVKEKTLVLEEGLAPMGYVRNIKIAKLPLVRADNSICAAAALTEEEARACLFKAALACRERTQKELNQLTKMCDDIANRVVRAPKKVRA